MKKLVIFICIVFALGTHLLAQSTISFQGKLIEDGTPVNGNRNFQFSIPDVSWIETHSNVSVIEGLYSVTLGNGDTPTPLPQLFEGVSERQLIISVDGNVLTPVTLTAPYQNRYFDGDVTLDEGKIELLSQGVPVATISAAEGLDQNGDPIGEQFGLINLTQTGGGFQSFLGSGRLIFEDPDGGTVKNGSELNWNSMSIFGVDDEIDGQLVFNWMNGGAEGRNRGALFLWGDQATKDATGVDIWRAALNVRDDDYGKDVGWLALGGPHAGGSTPVGVTAFVEAGAFVTDDVGDNHGGKVFIRGVNSDDPLGSFEVLRDGDGNEWASLVVRSSDGTEKVIDPFSSGGNEPIDIVIDVPGGGEESVTVIRGVAQGVANGNWQRGIVGESNTDLGFNMGVHGIANAPAGNDEFSYGVYGTADGDGSGVHYGVRGEINNSPASLNIAVRGRAAAEGDGSEFAAQFGGWFNSQNNLTKNVGVRAFANTGTGSNNYGIWATAQGGDGTNYAGRFDGDIQINSDRMSMGRKDWESNPQLPFFAFRGTQELLGDVGDCDGDPNTADEPCPYLPDLIWMNVEEDGQGNEIGVLNLRSSDGTEFRIDPFGTGGGGFTDININDPDGNSIYSANVVSTDVGNGPEPPYAGESFHWGGGTPNVQIGAPIWENDNNGAKRGFISIYGGTPDEGGGWYRSFVNMSVNRENDNEYGIFGLEGPNSPNVSFSAHGYDGGSGADRPFFDMYGSTSSFDPNDNNCDDPNTTEFEPCINYPSLVNFDIQDDGNGNEIGVLHLRSSDGTEFRLDPFGLGDPNFQSLNVLSSDGQNNVVELGHHGQNGNIGFLHVKGSDGSNKANLYVNDDGNGNEWGSLNLSSPSGYDNISTNYKTWEPGNEDLPIFSMRGSLTQLGDIGDCDGDPNTAEEPCPFRPDLISLQVQGNGGASEAATLDLNNDSGSANVSLGLGGNNQDSPFMNFNWNGQVPMSLNTFEDGTSNLNINGPNGTQSVNIGNGGSDGNFGRISLMDNGGVNRVELNVSDQGAGELSLGSLSNTPNVSLGSAGTGGNFGQLTLHNDVGDPKAELIVNDDGAGSNFATLDLTNNWDNSAIHLNASSGSIRFTDSGGSDVWLNGLTLNGLNTNSIDKDFVNATTHVEVGNYFGSDAGSGPTDGGYIGADGSIDGANLHVRGNVDADGQVSAGGMVLSSDRRLKDNITPLSTALENTLKLRGVSYFWKDKLKGENRQIGVIAQEVEEIYPEFVHTDAEGMKSVNYSQMVAVLIESVKELNTRIESLEAENTELKASLVNSANTNTKSIDILTTQLNNLQQQINLLIKQPHTGNDDVEISEQK